MQSYNLMRADVSAATSGTQNISYEVDYPLLRQRIDRRIQPSRECSKQVLRPQLTT